MSTRKRPVGCRWIYTVKYKADGSIERFKARLVAKGYTQTYGIDYTKTFAPVAKINTVRVLLMHGVRKAMSEGEQIEEVIVWVEAIPESMVWKVHKVNGSFFGYRQSNSDHTLFLKKQHGKITTLIVYVDDMVVTGNDLEERKALQNYLSREFEMKDLGKIPETCGRLMYLAHTRPDLAYSLSVVSQYMHNPGEQHMNAVMRILRYLKNAPGKGILFAKNVDHQSIEVYTDVDWAGAVDDRRSTSGYFTFVGGNLVTWKSKKQNVVTHSSAEVEFRGMTLRLCEALWLRLLLQDLGYLSKQPIRLFCDNKVACDIARNLVQHDRTKHVEVDRFFIKEKLDDKIVELPKIRLEDQLADILIKVVLGQVLQKILDKLGMCDIYALT
ncbi:Retrovirus-related Pol polyprotein from transposon RE2 [Vitis vinifera]|uniref:Retrovirus-related Pol polyprotein from transposon RE2 n=1 Tax=Vitis vinifera TaxID=29760 RepID=A0A438FJK7_VITVI|nr:Retrovirus-related Pol polyprotein from transposon RE2 [Vitis vinifera]